MKKLFLATAIATLGILLQQTASAQQHKVVYMRAVPEWVPVNGYWVVESNKKTPRRHTIYFYNDSSELIYTEKINGLRLKVKKDKVKMQLKRALEEVLLTWEKKKQPVAGYDVVVNHLRHN